jgi:broad specificity phosphatase PhoE
MYAYVALRQSWANGAWTHTDWGDYRHRFEGGESLNDVGARADRIVEHVVLPWAHEAARRDEDVVVVIVAHGIVRL